MGIAGETPRSDWTWWSETATNRANSCSEACCRITGNLRGRRNFRRISLSQWRYPNRNGLSNFPGSYYIRVKRSPRIYFFLEKVERIKSGHLVWTNSNALKRMVGILKCPPVRESSYSTMQGITAQVLKYPNSLPWRVCIIMWRSLLNHCCASCNSAT